LAALVVAIGAISAPASASPTQAHPPRTGAPSHPLWRYVPGGFIPTTSLCKAVYGIACYQPAQLQKAYDLNSLYLNNLDGRGTTIAIVDAFGSPSIKRDLAHFDSGFNIAAPPHFTIIQPVGKVPPYHVNADRFGWAFETTLDVEWAHAMAPGANILLVETPSTETEGLQGFPKIVQAENYVINHHLAE
jgi:Predicted protease